MDSKAFHPAKAIFDGIEAPHMIRKGHFIEKSVLAYK
jgi:hypothetical protein